MSQAKEAKTKQTRAEPFAVAAVDAFKGWQRYDSQMRRWEFAQHVRNGCAICGVDVFANLFTKEADSIGVDDAAIVRGINAIADVVDEANAPRR